MITHKFVACLCS